MQAHSPPDTSLIAFNTSADITSDVQVINTRLQLKPRLTDPVAAFDALVMQTCPAEIETLKAHLIGEFGNTPETLERNTLRHIQLTELFIKALDTHTPDHVFLWNQFNLLHRHFAHILKQRGIPNGFFHDGLLPGSITLDVDAEMGESWVARDPERFQNIPVSPEARARARAFLNAVQSDSMNRHVQVDKIDLNEMLKATKCHDRPIVFYAGQADWHAGLLPDGPTRVHHSPFFESSLAALTHLDKVAGELGFFVLFKPHPLSREKYTFLDADMYPNTLILSSVSLQSCLDVAAVVTTIASQTSYVALLAGKPVVMLGINQISGKGLTYDLASGADLGDLILTALQDPLAPDRADDLADHVARLERTYLFDFGTLDIPFYRRGPAAAAELVQDCLEHDKAHVINKILSRAT
jgi:hypothetical protein